MSSKTFHVAPVPAGWEVRSEGAQHAVSVTATQVDAIQAGRQVARDQRAELVVHRPDGSIRSKDNFGRGPFPPRDPDH
jgi:hypothetical protein